MREKVGKSRNTVFFQWFVAPEGRKVGSPKRRVRSQLARWEMNICTPLWREAHFEVKMYKAHHCGGKHISKSKCKKKGFGPLLEVAMSKKCTPLWREAHFEVKMYKAHHCRTTFGSCDVEKVHAVVARNTFWSQNVQNTPLSDHFWKLRCRKSARRCGAKRISKSKCTKHTIVGPLLEVAMLKKCTPLWREAHFEVVQSTPLSDHFWKLRCRKSARRCGAKHILKSTCTKHTIVGPLLEVEMLKKCTSLWREAHFQVKMHKTPHVRATFGGSDVEKVHAVVARSTIWSQNVQNTPCSDHFWRFRCRFASLRVITLHYTHHYTTVHYTTLHSTTPQLQLQNYTTYTTTLHYTPLH